MRYIKNRSHICRKGSFTVEAALIMPVILGTTVLFINAAMVFYDRCTMEFICQMACQRAVYDSEAEMSIDEDITDQLSEKLILNWDTAVETNSDDEYISAQITASGRFFNSIFIHKAKACKHFCPKY